MPSIRTILGDIDAGKLGFTMAHEHLITRPTERWMKIEQDNMLDSPEKAVDLLEEFKSGGGEALIEMTTARWGRHVPGMVNASKETGVHVIATTGYMCQAFDIPSDIRHCDMDSVVEEMVKDVNEGMDGTEHKAGVIKAGTAYMKVTPDEEYAFRAACRASKISGAPVSTHTTAGTMGIEQVELAIDEGLDPERLIIAHIDRNPDLWYHRKILSMGAYLIYDGPGKVKYYPDSVRVELLRQLVDEGYEDKIMLSNDMGKRAYHPAYGGTPGMSWIARKFLPRLIDEGFSEETLQKFMVENPAKAFSMA